MVRHDDVNNFRQSAIELLVRPIARKINCAGDHSTAFPPLSLHRRDRPTEPIACIYGLGLAVTIQGGKQVMLGDKIINYGPGDSLLTMIDSPMIAAITRATKHEPYLALLLKLDPSVIALLASDMKLPQPEETRPDAPIPIERLDAEILDALHRLVALLDAPLLLPRVAPLIQQEITIHLLTGPHGSQLHQLSLARLPSAEVARVVAWLKQNFTKAIPVDALAALAKMSPSAFRQHFRAITGMSPLQYQKQLRLQEARQLMLNQSIDASRAAFLVGYESTSQFSREYRRQFGAPPQRDVRHVRAI